MKKVIGMIAVLILAGFTMAAFADDAAKPATTPAAPTAAPAASPAPVSPFAAAAAKANAAVASEAVKALSGEVIVGRIKKIDAKAGTIVIKDQTITVKPEQIVDIKEGDNVKVNLVSGTMNAETVVSLEKQAAKTKVKTEAKAAKEKAIQAAAAAAAPAATMAAPAAAPAPTTPLAKANAAVTSEAVKALSGEVVVGRIKKIDAKAGTIVVKNKTIKVKPEQIADIKAGENVKVNLVSGTMDAEKVVSLEKKAVKKKVKVEAKKAKEKAIQTAADAAIEKAAQQTQQAQ